MVDSHYIFVIYRKYKNEKVLLAWTDSINLLKKYLPKISNYKIKETTYEKAVNRYGDIDNLKIIDYDNDTYLAEDVYDVIKDTKDNELYNLASCIKYMSTLNIKYDKLIDKKYATHINKSIEIMKYLFDNIENEQLIEEELSSIPKSSLDELRRQSEFIRNI